ncbi:MAG: DUF1439 domain-containing protein [Aeromonas sp.]
MLLTSLLMTASLFGQGNLEITEPQIKDYLHNKLQTERNLELPGMLKAQLKLGDHQVRIARDGSDVVRVTGTGALNAELPDTRRYEARISMTYEAQPRFDREKNALFLSGMRLVDYQLTPDPAQQQFGFMLKLLLQAAVNRFEFAPIYQVPADDPLHNRIESISLRPGMIELQLKQGAL